MLKVGLLWYDADPKRAREIKIDDAAGRYLEKFGVPPNACHVNPEDKTSHPWLTVVGNKAIRPNHFWLGVDEELEPVPVVEANARLEERAKASGAQASRSRPNARELGRPTPKKRQTKATTRRRLGVEASGTVTARRRARA